MRLSREKVVHLSHILIEHMENDPAIKLREESNAIRNYIVDVLMKELIKDEKMEETARRKIRSMKKNVVEGSRDWDILFWKYYQEELDKLRQIKE
jgi:hypothetical protein